MSAPENPAAFPLPETDVSHGQYGMSLRDWFAGQALAGLLPEYLDRNGFGHATVGQNSAAHAYRIADAMLAERAKARP